MCARDRPSLTKWTTAGAKALAWHCNDAEELIMPEKSARPVGPWGKFFALFLGVPPIAVLATDEDDEAENSAEPPRR